MMKLLHCRRRIACAFLVCLACLGAAVATDDDYAKVSVSQLIDDLTIIDSQSPGINSSGIYEGFIAEDAFGSFHGGVLGVATPRVSPQMRELVRRGPAALPELIKHLDDTRPTKVEVGNKGGMQVGVDVFAFSYFSNEYDPRLHHWFSEKEIKSGRALTDLMAKDFTGRYTVKVGDVCYVLIGQIVNRHLFAVRYQPSAGLVVNSPIEAPALAEKVKSDWGTVDADMLKASLLEDIRTTNRPKEISDAANADRFVNPAMQRLRFYFPGTYNALTGEDLKKKKEFEKQEAIARKRN